MHSIFKEVTGEHGTPVKVKWLTETCYLKWVTNRQHSIRWNWLSTIMLMSTLEKTNF